MLPEPGVDGVEQEPGVGVLAPPAAEPPVGVVVITDHRRVQALPRIGRLLALAERPRVVVVAERRWMPPRAEARLAAFDRPRRESRARRYLG